MRYMPAGLAASLPQYIYYLNATEKPKDQNMPSIDHLVSKSNAHTSLSGLLLKNRESATRACRKEIKKGIGLQPGLNTGLTITKLSG